MKVITFATKQGGAFKFLNESFHRLSDSTKHDLIVVGYGQQWRGFGNRLIQYRDAIALLDPKTVCLVMDAYDTLLTGDLAALETDYNATGEGKVVFSTETHDFFSAMNNYCLMDASILRANDTIFINAGAYIGTAKALVKMLDQVLPECYNNVHCDDQYLLTKLCRESPDDYLYDTDNKWFLTWTMNTTRPEDVELSMDGTLSYLKKQHPFLLHRPFAADLSATITALGYTMTDEDRSNVARDRFYYLKFYQHHIQHRWSISSNSMKLMVMLFVVAVISLVLLLLILYVSFSWRPPKSVHWKMTG